MPAISPTLYSALFHPLPIVRPSHLPPLGFPPSLRMHSAQRDYPNILQAIQQNHTDIAKIYAQNAIRKQNEKLNLLRLASRIDAVSSRVQTAVTMRQVTGSMANVVRGMDGAMKSMDLEKVRIFPLPVPWTASFWQWIYMILAQGADYDS